MKNLIFSIALFIIVLASCSSATESPTVPKSKVPVYTVKADNHQIQQQYPARIQGAIDIEIRPQINGVIAQVLVEEGSFVQKGQGLFRINEAPFRQALNQALGNLNAAKARVLQTQTELDKLLPLVENKIISDLQMRSAEAAHALANAEVAQAQAVLESAKINLAYTQIAAPVSGYIGRLPKKQGSIISSMDVEPLTTLSDVSKLYVYFSLGEVDFNKFKSQYAGVSLTEKIKNTDSVTLLLADQEVYPQKGRIDLVDGQFDKNTGAIMLRASFANSHGLLRSGNTGKIILEMKYANTLSIPQEATQEIQDKTFVFMVDDQQKISKQAVQIVGRTGSNYLLDRGLNAGDRIVIRGFQNLMEGQEVDIAAEDDALAQK